MLTNYEGIQWRKPAKFLIAIQTKLENKLNDMTGTMRALHEGHTLMNNIIQMLMKKIELMARYTAQPKTNKEMPKMATRTSHVD